MKIAQNLDRVWIMVVDEEELYVVGSEMKVKILKTLYRMKSLHQHVLKRMLGIPRST